VVATLEQHPDASIRSLARTLHVRRQTIRRCLLALDAARGRVQNPQMTGYAFTRPGDGEQLEGK